MAVLPEVTARLDADVSGFIRAWNDAAQAAERNAARIRAAQAGLDDLNAGGGGSNGLRDLNAEMERLSRIARQAADSIREMGNSARGAGGDLDQLGERARRAGGGLGGLGAGMGRSRAQAALMAAAILVISSVLPAIAAAALAAGAALQGLGVAGLVIAGGWRGMKQAGDQLKASLGGLQGQLESTFRSGLSQEFRKLGEAISGLSGPIQGIAGSVVGVVKAFTGWIRSAQGMAEVEQMLGGVNNMLQTLQPGAEALAKAFTGFGAAAAPAMDEIGAALSSVFENLEKVLEKGKETGKLGEAFEAGAMAIEAFGEVLAGIVDIMIEMAAQGGEPAADAIKKFGQALQDAAPLLGQMFSHFAQMLNILMTVVGWFAKLAKALEPVYRAMEQANEALTGFIKAISPEKVKEFGEAIKKAFGELKDWVKKGVDDAVTAVKEWWTKTTADTKEGAKKVVQEVKDWWKKTEQDVKDGVKKVTQDVKDWWKKTSQDIKSGAKKAVQDVKEWWNDTVAEVKAGVQKWIDEIKAWWDKTVEDVKGGAEKVVEEIKGMVENVTGELDKWVGDMETAGKDAGEGLDSGLQQATNKVVATATAIAKAAMNAIKTTLGIASPSIAFRDEVGAMIPAGIAAGIIGNAGAITDAMNRSGLGALAAGRGALGGGALGRSGRQTLTLHVVGGADSAAGTFIARLAQQGKLKITANAVVGR